MLAMSPLAYNRTIAKQSLATLPVKTSHSNREYISMYSFGAYRNMDPNG